MKKIGIIGSGVVAKAPEEIGSFDSFPRNFLSILKQGQSFD
jgi:hypothetical protein